MKNNHTTAQPEFTTVTTTADDSWNMRDMIVKFGVTQTEILEAVREVGKNKTKVEEYLAARK